MSKSRQLNYQTTCSIFGSIAYRK